ncbi:hypothetical protein [Streptomyces sp. TS71-3]|uniref:hypothetical protein n=1 Tax=Streptomyces sp. TS71-3 TaxID=2733862 RepID=UPI001B088DB7|nr:hypothetical protein [Streptomyces sp. TS71-3]GHJ39834.1 hypothetical protein Sm713_54430 [Streptomyces sp. TS71-3]
MNEPTPNTRQSPAQARPEALRLLPWTGEGGKPCYLSTPENSDGGYVARVADRIEAEQLGAAADLLDEAREMLAARSWTGGELHLLAIQLTESLTYVHRIAESRGARLGAAPTLGLDPGPDPDPDPTTAPPRQPALDA